MNGTETMTVAAFERMEKQAKKNKARFLKLDKRESKLMAVIDEIRAKKASLLGIQSNTVEIKRRNKSKSILPYGQTTKVVLAAFAELNKSGEMKHSTDEITDKCIAMDKRLAKANRDEVRVAVRNALANRDNLFTLVGHSLFCLVEKAKKSNAAKKIVKNKVEVKTETKPIENSPTQTTEQANTVAA